MMLVVLLTAGFATDAVSQSGKPKRSPAEKATGKIGNANVSIQYSSPSVRGRKIWGELVPYGKVWRAGANEATLLETDKDLMVEGKKLAAGKYSVYAIPGEQEWQIIFNTQTGQWGVERNGDTTRKPEKDALVVSVKPHAAAMAENLKYQITGNGFSLLWDKLEIPVTVK